MGTVTSYKSGYNPFSSRVSSPQLPIPFHPSYPTGGSGGFQPKDRWIFHPPRQETPKDTFVSMRVGDFQKQSRSDGPGKRWVLVSLWQNGLTNCQQKSNPWIKSIKSKISKWNFCNYFFWISSNPILNPMYINPFMQQSYNNPHVQQKHKFPFHRPIYLLKVSFPNWTNRRTEALALPRHTVSLKWMMNIASLGLRSDLKVQLFNVGPCQTHGIHSG